MSRGAIVACSCSSRLPQDVVLESSHDVFEKRRCSQSIMFLWKQRRSEAICIVPKRVGVGEDNWGEQASMYQMGVLKNPAPTGPTSHTHTPNAISTCFT